MRTEKGFSLIEVLIALVIFSLIGVGFLSGLGTGLKVLSQTDVLETAKNLAESQMEYVKGLDYRSTGSYPEAPIPDEYPGFSAAINAGPVTDRDANIQEILVTISLDGEAVLTLEGYKVNT